jgi:hypothetical protein
VPATLHFSVADANCSLVSASVDPRLSFFSPRSGMVADRFTVDGHWRASGTDLAMRFMILLKADKNTEAGIPPSAELIVAAMAEEGRANHCFATVVCVKTFTQ